MGAIAEDYLAAQASFAELARSLTADEWAREVPCCPGWTVRDVLSHVVGLADDVLAGRIEGAASDAWTAAQVERWRTSSVGELLDRWEQQAPQVAPMFDAIGETRPPIDCTAHEHDVRHALGRPGGRDGAIVARVAADLRDGLVVPPGLDDFELFRSRLGRRSAQQVRSYAWVVPPSEDQLRGWFLFGPSAVDILE